MVLEYDKNSSKFGFGKSQLNVQINNEIKSYNMELPRIPADYSLTTAELFKGTVMRVGMISIFSGPIGKASNDFTEIFDQKNNPYTIFHDKIPNEKLFILLFPQQSKDKTVYDINGKIKFKFGKGSRFLFKNNEISNLSRFNNFNNILPLFYFSKFIKKGKGKKIFSKLINYLLILLKSSHYNQKVALSDKIFGIISAFISNSTNEFFSHETIEVFAELKNLIIIPELKFELIENLICNDMILNGLNEKALKVANFFIKVNFCKYIRSVFIQEPKAMLEKIPIARLLQISKKMDYNSSCCEFHNQYLLNQSAIKDDSCNSFENEIWNFLGIIEAVAATYPESSIESMNELIDFMAIKSSPCYLIALLKIFKFILSTVNPHSLNSIRKNMKEKKASYVLLSIFSTNPFPDIRVICVKLLNLMIQIDLSNLLQSEISKFIAHSLVPIHKSSLLESLDDDQLEALTLTPSKSSRNSITNLIKQISFKKKDEEKKIENSKEMPQTISSINFRKAENISKNYSFDSEKIKSDVFQIDDNQLLNNSGFSNKHSTTMTNIPKEFSSFKKSKIMSICEFVSQDFSKNSMDYDFLLFNAIFEFTLTKPPTTLDDTLSLDENDLLIHEAEELLISLYEISSLENKGCLLQYLLTLGKLNEKNLSNLSNPLFEKFLVDTLLQTAIENTDKKTAIFELCLSLWSLLGKRNWINEENAVSRLIKSEFYLNSKYSKTGKNYKVCRMIFRLMQESTLESLIDLARNNTVNYILWRNIGEVSNFIFETIMGLHDFISKDELFTALMEGDSFSWNSHVGLISSFTDEDQSLIGNLKSFNNSSSWIDEKLALTYSELIKRFYPLNAVKMLEKSFTPTFSQMADKMVQILSKPFNLIGTQPLLYVALRILSLSVEVFFIHKCDALYLKAMESLISFLKLVIIVFEASSINSYYKIGADCLLISFKWLLQMGKEKKDLKALMNYKEIQEFLVLVGNKSKSNINQNNSFISEFIEETFGSNLKRFTTEIKGSFQLILYNDRIFHNNFTFNFLDVKARSQVICSDLSNEIKAIVNDFQGYVFTLETELQDEISAKIEEYHKKNSLQIYTSISKVREARLSFHKVWGKIRIYDGIWRHPDINKALFTNTNLNYKKNTNNRLFTKKISKYSSIYGNRNFMKIVLKDPELCTPTFSLYESENLAISNSIAILTSHLKLCLKMKIFEDLQIMTGISDGIVHVSMECLWIKTLTVRKGVFFLTRNFIVFAFLSLQEKKNHLSFLSHQLGHWKSLNRKWPLTSVTSIHRRRFLDKKCAIEIFFIEGFSKLLSFSSIQEVDEILSKILLTTKTIGKEIEIINDPKKKSEILKEKWCNGKISNFNYLMCLNKLSGRSYNDITRFYVFPWIISNYSETDDTFPNENDIRDLSKSMGNSGNQERINSFKERFQNTDLFNNAPKFHFGSHYSSPAIVIYFLVRVNPFTRAAIELQNGKFDLPDRLFNSIEDSYKSASEELSDVRELIPEFYYFPDFLVNSENHDFGLQQCGNRVHNVKLPAWAKNLPHKFVSTLRKYLESDNVSKNLSKWIDLVFGYKQRGKEAEKAINVFYYLTYEENLEDLKYEDEGMRTSVESQIIHFGQTPSQLFSKPHPSKISNHTFPIIDSDISVDKIYLKSESKSSLLAIHYIKDSIWTFTNDFILNEYKFGDNKFGEKCFKLILKTEIPLMYFDKSIEKYSRFPMIFETQKRIIIFGGIVGGFIHVFNYDKNEDSYLIKLHNSTITVVEINASRLFTGTKDGEIRISKLEKEKRVTKLFSVFLFEEQIYSIAISISMKIFLVSNKKGQIYTLNIFNGHKNAFIKGKPNSTLYLSELPLASIVEISSHEIKVYDFAGQVIKSMIYSALESNFVTNEIDQDCLIVGNLEGEISILEMPYLSVLKRIEFNDKYKAIKLRGSKNTILLSDNEGNLCMVYSDIDQSLLN